MIFFWCYRLMIIEAFSAGMSGVYCLGGRKKKLVKICKI